MYYFKKTGLGIKSSNPRYWLPNPAKSVIMSPQQFGSFMSSGQPAPMRTPSVPAGSGLQGRTKPCRVPY